MTRQQKSQAGFTLVELAIVMIIIGLLIAGVLKGQELIGNARVTSTVAQIKGIDAAVSTFKDTYSATPGDMSNPNTRLPNCTGPCNTGVATSDTNLSTAFNAAPGVEATGFFPQLAAANLITGITPATGNSSFGVNFPAAKIDGVGIIPGSITGATPAATGLAAAVGTVGTNAGLFLALGSSAAAAQSANTTGLKPNQALRIDTKLDDGLPGVGDVVGYGTNCGTAGTAGTYTTTANGNTCGIYARIQG